MNNYICYCSCSYRTNSGYCGYTGGYDACQYRLIAQKPITNADRIRAMNDEKLAEFLTRYVWHEDDIEGDFLSHLVADTLGWLRQEATDD